MLLIFACVALLFLYIEAMKGLRELTDAALSIVKGNLDVRIFRERKDRIRRLGELLNEIASKIKEIQMQLADKQAELRAVIACVEDPIFITDGLGRIRLSNGGFKRLVNEEKDEGRHVFDLLRFPEFNLLLKEAKERGCVTQEAKMEKRIFLVNVSVLPTGDAFVFALRDVTDLRNLEKVKKEFVSNISHELRTPLTVIKGFVETVEGEIAHNQYVETIKRHTERLVRILDGLLFLSELEERGGQMDREMVDVRAIAERVAKLFERRLSEKGIDFRFESDENLPLIMANGTALEQMFLNLIDNSIKYTNEGRITVRLGQEASFLSVMIEDTGIGIPKEHIPRIFERFYMVDRTRSKALGGSGLGLAIVKHIVLSHNGTIQVESEESKGSKFIVKLPIGNLGEGLRDHYNSEKKGCLGLDFVDSV